MRVVRILDLIDLFNLMPEPPPELANLLIGLRVLPTGQSIEGDPDPHMITGIVSDDVVLVQHIAQDGRVSPADTCTGRVQDWTIDPRSLISRLRLIYVVGRLLYDEHDMELAGFCWWSPRKLPAEWATAHGLFEVLPSLPLDAAVDLLCLLVRGLLGLEDLSRSYAVPLVGPVDSDHYVDRMLTTDAAGNVTGSKDVMRCRHCRAMPSQPHHDRCPLVLQ